MPFFKRQKLSLGKARFKTSFKFLKKSAKYIKFFDQKLVIIIIMKYKMQPPPKQSTETLT